MISNEMFNDFNKYQNYLLEKSHQCSKDSNIYEKFQRQIKQRESAQGQLNYC